MLLSPEVGHRSWATLQLTVQENMALSNKLGKSTFYAAFWKATNSVFVAASRWAFSSR
jgi:hypothetical protein